MDKMVAISNRFMSPLFPTCGEAPLQVQPISGTKFWIKKASEVKKNRSLSALLDGINIYFSFTFRGNSGIRFLDTTSSHMGNGNINLDRINRMNMMKQRPTQSWLSCLSCQKKKITIPSSEVPPQTDELVALISCCLMRTDAGFWMPDSG